MIERIIRSSFARPVVALLLVLAGSLLCAVWLRDLKRDVFPDLSAPVFNVIVQRWGPKSSRLRSPSRWRSR